MILQMEQYSKQVNFLKTILMHFSLFYTKTHLKLQTPLGSAKKKHKIFADYYSLGNLHSSVRSAIDTMQFVLLCKETDFKKQKDSGPVKLFQHLIKDLKKLENEGVYLGDKWGRKRGTVAFILGII